MENEQVGRAAHRHPDWMGLLKQAVSRHIARSAKRVRELREDYREEHAEQGRLGGEIALPSRPTHPPAPRAKPATSPATDRSRTADEAPAAASGSGRRVWDITKEVFQEFGKDNGTLLAASLAFYLLLSLVPLVLVGISILGYVLHGNAAAKTHVYEFLGQFLGGQQDVIQTAVNSVVQKRGLTGGIGLIGLVFTATGGFATLESAINVVWSAPNRSFVMNKLFALLMLAIVGTLFLLSFGVTAAAQWAGHVRALHFLANSWVLRAIALILPVGISGVMFTFIYRFYPNGRSTWRASLIAGFVTAVLWELAKNGYALYTHYIHQEATYGTLGGLVGLIMWIYYSSALVLLGSELTWVLEGCPDMSKEAKEGAKGSAEGGLKSPQRQEAQASR